MLSIRIIALPAVKLTSALLLALPLVLPSSPVDASANKPKPGQTATTCYYNFGPKLGQTENLSGKIKPVLIGKACADGIGNSGIAVLDQEDEETEEAQEAVKEMQEAGKAFALQTDKNSVQLTTNCQFKQGPRAGQSENYQGKFLPVPIGSTCSDGVRSVGITIAE